MNIIPKPTNTKKSAGDFIINEKTFLVVDSKNFRLFEIAKYFKEYIKAPTGFELNVVDKNGYRNESYVELNIDENNVSLGSEGYLFSVTAKVINITAFAPAGIFYGIQTLLQLLPVQIFSNKVRSDITWSLQCVEIKDVPKYSWRGMHLDVCRHFYSKNFIKRYIDLLAMHKMNVFHWHLTEDQGWRIEIKKYPKLTEVGAWRVDRSGITWNERSTQQSGEVAGYGGYYTQKDVKDIIDYAAERYVTVIPEIELPGHALAALAAYPEYSCTGGPFHVATGGYWPITDVYCPGNENTFSFLEDILTEVMNLFPGKYIHIGGDEVHKSNWEKCPKCQKRMVAEGLNGEKELQSYFIKRIEKFILAKGKKLIGWDEILEGGLAPEATVMSWRGIQGGVEAAKQKHDVIMTPTDHCYFDYYQGHLIEEPEAFSESYLPIEKVYDFDPTPTELSKEESKHILGGQGNVWTEYMPTSEQVEYMSLPRMSALAEAVWSSNDERNFSEFRKRMETHCLRLDEMNINYRKLDK